MINKIKHILIISTVVLMGLIVGFLQIVRTKVNDNEVRVASVESMVPNGGSVLVVFPHPDDEVCISGTLKQLSEAGIETNYLCLTRGEKGSRRKGQTVDDLISERRDELQNACRILGVEQLMQDTLPDGGLNVLPDSILEAAIWRGIKMFKPETILTYDTNKGLYGHVDHIRTACAVEHICKQSQGDANFCVKQVIGTTQPAKLMEVLMAYSPKFKKRFYKVNTLNLPLPDFSVKVFSVREAKEELFTNYNKRKIISNLLPHKKFLPSVVFHHLHNKDYMYYIWKSE